MMERDLGSIVVEQAQRRLQARAGLVLVKGEAFTLARPLVRDVAAAQSVPEDDVWSAIKATPAGVLRLSYDADGEIVALRADPF